LLDAVRCDEVLSKKCDAAVLREAFARRLKGDNASKTPWIDFEKLCIWQQFLKDQTIKSQKFIVWIL
jgi:hypothetical protein